jgi:hypothetical protein
MTRATLALAVLATLAGCSKKPTEDACEKLLNHVVDLEMAAGGTSGGDKAELDAQRKKVSDDIGKDFLNSCVKDLPMKQLECGMAAKTLEDLGKCDKS